MPAPVSHCRSGDRSAEVDGGVPAGRPFSSRLHGGNPPCKSLSAADLHSTYVLRRPSSPVPPAKNFCPQLAKTNQVKRLFGLHRQKSSRGELQKSAHSGCCRVKHLIYNDIFVEHVAERFQTARIQVQTARIRPQTAHFHLRRFSRSALIFSLYIIDKERDINLEASGNHDFQVREFGRRQKIYCAKKKPVRGFFAHFCAPMNKMDSMTYHQKGVKCAGARKNLPLPSLRS